MKTLKQKLTRVIALLIAAILVGICAFKSTDAALKYIKTDDNTDYITGYDYAHDMSELYTQLWLLGNMYLSNLDSKGNFAGNEYLKASTESSMKELGLMDSEGNIIIPTTSDFEYCVEYGNVSFSNTEKNYDDIYNSIYSYAKKNNSVEMPSSRHWYYGEYYWYSTSYGMSYYTFPYYNYNYAAAVFNYDTAGLDYYVDENDVRIYCKSDGSTPTLVESDDYFDVENYGYTYYDDGKDKWIGVNTNDFKTMNGNESQLKICITPNEALIEIHEFAVNAREAEMEKIVNSLLNLIPLAVIILILTLFVLITGGYSVREGKYVLSGVDKIFVELFIAGICGAVLLCVALVDYNVFAEIRSFANTYIHNDYAVQIIYCAVYTAIFVLTVCLINSLIVRLKCRSFWKTTIVGLILYKMFLMLKKFFTKIKNSFITKEMLRNDIFTKRFAVTFALLIAAEILVVILSVATGSFAMLVILTITLCVIYVLLVCRDLRDLKQLSEQITDICGGDYTKKEVPERSGIYGMTTKLNNISDGIQSAVERQVKSERMKIDLVTNVSHDLKTPLTSITSYINLLSMEELNPEARDYVTILEQKSERLNVIVSDLFDLAKATSHTDINLERIDAVILVGQVLADMADKINSYGKEIRTDISMETAPIYAEGKKLYRVLQNLIDNALKYSLDSTRIYLRLHEDGSDVVIQIKNISSYEMKFSPEEVTERFTRGDEARTSEGNGLGLSIAKSFTEACGGSFAVVVDDDLFVAEVHLPLSR